MGATPEDALALARRNRPKERFTLRFVEADEGELLMLPLLMDELRPFFHTLSTPVYLVGGAVRDALLKRPLHDLDFVLPHGGIKLAFQIGDLLGVPAYILDKERDTGRVMHGAMTLDFAQFRGPTLEDDLRGRDFTINAIALPANARRRHSLIDPLGGADDLQAGILRLAAPTALVQDPVRAVRAVRMIATLPVRMDEMTQTAVSAIQNLPQQTSAERIRDAFLQLLESDRPATAVSDLQTLGLLPQILPELTACVGVTQSAPHWQDVFEHSLTTLRMSVHLEAALATETVVGGANALVREALLPFLANLQTHWSRLVNGGQNGRLLFRLAALLHDVGKPLTRSVEEDGRVRFLGHDAQGAQLVEQRLTRLRMSNEAEERVKRIIRHHMYPLYLLHSHAESPLSRRTVFRYFRKTGVEGVDIAILSLADHLATTRGEATADFKRQLALTQQLFVAYFEQHEQVVAPPPLVNGRDLIAQLALQPGPEIGRLLRLIAEAQAAGEIQTRQEALDFARRARG